MKTMYLNKLKKHYNSLIFLSVIFFHQTLLAEEPVQIYLDGINLETVITEAGVEPAILVTEDLTLPDESILLWPCIFNGDINRVTITALFNEIPLVFITSDSLDNNATDFCAIDIDDVKGEIGELTIKLESNSTLPASLFLIQNASIPISPAIIMYLLN
ncbi:hypothetical protein ACFLRS_00765 [Campylobacterota bacterium]